MNIKEAIKWLKEVQSHIDLEMGGNTQEMYDALELAIGKLQANDEQVTGELISREALKKAIDTIKQTGYDVNEEPVEFVELPDLIKAIDNAPTVEQNWKFYYEHGYAQAKREFERPTGEWIPVTTRPMTDDEWEELSDEAKDYIDEDEKWFFDCPMPENGQNILISTKWGVWGDTCEISSEGGINAYYLEGHGDWDGVEAWMPLPEPYKEGGAEE